MLAITVPVDLDNGPPTNRSARQRMCAVTRVVRPVDELIRFVVSPVGQVVPDVKRKLPGRGLWIAASRQAVAKAVTGNHFSRGFRREVHAAPRLPEDTEELLVRGVIEALAIAAKAGEVVAGFAKVEAALQQHQVTALIHAADGAADGIRKLDAIARQNTANIEESRKFPVIGALTSEQLDLALGRSNVVHAALLAGSAGKTFLSRSQLLVRYRMADDDRTAGQTAGNN